MNDDPTRAEEAEGDAKPAPSARANLERCLSCRFAVDKNEEKGTLVCKKHSMLINANDDEIPDDCKEYEK